MDEPAIRRKPLTERQALERYRRESAHLQRVIDEGKALHGSAAQRMFPRLPSEAERREVTVARQKPRGALATALYPGLKER